MSVPSNAAATLRTHWATRFIDAVSVVRVTARGTYNAATYQYTGGTGNVEYSGGALIRPMSAAGESDLFGEEEVTGKIYKVFIPYTAPFTGNPQPEDEVEVTASVMDPTLVGKKLRVVSASHDSYLTRIQLICRLEEGPGYVD